jgi:hypothetical protein
MNAISAKLALLEADSSTERRSKRRRGSSDELTFTNASITMLDGISSEELRALREGPQQAIDLEVLKRKYEGFAGLGRRIAPRFSLNLSVVIMNHKGSSFRTESLNISESGALLKDMLPPNFMDSTFEILITYTCPETKTPQRLMFTGEAVGGPLRTPRVSFKSSANKTAELLQSLFVDLTPIAI